MKKILLVICILTFCFNSFAAENYSIYLVRHAEKLSESKNPSLTNCGVKRAELLAKMLSKTQIKTIYSTSYQRTMQTARPLAELQTMPIKQYNPKFLEQFSLSLKQASSNALVVGHSNTTPMLVELLSNQKVAPLTEKDYQYLYQVQFVDNQPYLTVFQQPLNCEASE